MTFSRSNSFIAAAVLICAATASVSADTVRRSDDTTLKGNVMALRDGGISVVPADGSPVVTIALDDLAEVIFDAPPPVKTTTPSTKPAKPNPATTQPAAKGDGAWRVTMHNGDSISLSNARWSAGTLTGTMAAGAVPLELAIGDVREAWLGTADRVKAAKSLGEKPGADDIAYAQRESQVLAVRGVALGLNDAGDALKFKFGSEERSIALTRLVGIVFAQDGNTSANASPVQAGLQQVVTLITGEAISGTWTTIDDKAIGLTTLHGQALSLPRDSVVRIHTRNGRVTSLSDLQPAKVEQTPYFDRLLSWQIDRSLEGKPLALADGPVARGIAVHARTVLTYELAGAYGEFKTKVGFQQPEGKLGEAVVRVLADGRVLFEKTDARGDKPSFDVSVSVQGVRQLTLEVDFGDGQDVGDRVVWANARLIRAAQR